MNAKQIITWNVLEKKIGNGNDTFFWLDIWVGNQSLRDKFNRLYKLDMVPGCMISSRFVNGAWHWQWRRELRGGREQQQFHDLMALISGQQLQDYPDSFAWNLDAEGVFSVGTTRKFIDDNNMIHALTGTR
ncbi:RNA-directed DNA polymerase, eukaryota [Artemisia annua]|uniref:RNA-directed DNA polymerase, eukaryota n=1 Tax=Artemisia annua TaxID=35608 RepID=A0A2U1LLC0_ARTAN|nr:RNA-directed DNA polymerase, eukaryota [Artemisia annua]